MTPVRGAAAFVIALLIGHSLAPVTCLGWESDAAARKACCQRAHHDHEQDQSAADDCCAKHEAGTMGAVSPTETHAISATIVGLADSSSVLDVLMPASPLVLTARQEDLHAAPHLSSPPLRR
jgi:hypothetical protein